MRGVSVDPLNRFGRFVVLANIAHEFAFEVWHRSKDAACDDLALDAVEPQLDLVEPGRVGGRIVNVDLGMVGQEVAHRLGLMGRQVVADDMNILTPGLLGDDIEWQKATNSALVWRATVLPRTLQLVLKAAYNESVP